MLEAVPGATSPGEVCKKKEVSVIVNGINLRSV